MWEFRDFHSLSWILRECCCFTMCSLWQYRWLHGIHPLPVVHTHVYMCGSSTGDKQIKNWKVCDKSGRTNEPGVHYSQQACARTRISSLESSKLQRMLRRIRWIFKLVEIYVVNMLKMCFSSLFSPHARFCFMIFPIASGTTRRYSFRDGFSRFFRMGVWVLGHAFSLWNVSGMHIDHRIPYKEQNERESQRKIKYESKVEFFSCGASRD